MLFLDDSLRRARVQRHGALSNYFLNEVSSINNVKLLLSQVGSQSQNGLLQAGGMLQSERQDDSLVSGGIVICLAKQILSTHDSRLGVHLEMDRSEESDILDYPFH